MDDAETGEQLVRRHARPGVPAAVSRRRRERREAELAAAFRRAGVDAVALSTDEDLLAGDRPDGRAAEAGEALTDVVHLAAAPAAPAGDPGRRVGCTGRGSGDGRRGRRSSGGGRRRRSRRRRARSGAASAGRRAGVAAPDPGRLTLVGVTILVLSLARPAERHRRPAAGGHGPPRLRRLGQHGRHRRRADPDGGGQGRRARVRRATSRRRCASASSSSATPGFSTQVPTDDRTADRGRDPAPRAGARDVARPAASSQSLTVIEAADDAETTDYYTNARAPPTPDADPGPGRRLRAGHHRAADRRREHRGARPARGGPGGAGTAASASTRSGSAAADGTTLEVEGFLVHTQLDEAALQGIADADRRHVLPGRGPGRPDARSTTTSAAGSSSAPSRSS